VRASILALTILLFLEKGCSMAALPNSGHGVDSAKGIGGCHVARARTQITGSTGSRNARTDDTILARMCLTLHDQAYRTAYDSFKAGESVSLKAFGSFYSSIKDL
jgi:hypothetical protein